MMDFTGIKKLTIDGVSLKQLFVNGIQIWRSGYKNWVPFSTEADGVTIYNGTGYQEGKRLSSSGALKDQAGSVATGFIPAESGDLIRMKGVTWGTSVRDGYCYIIYYDSNFQRVFTINKYRNDPINNNMSNFTDKSKVDLTTSSIITDADGVTTFNINFNTIINYSYIRISADGEGANMIVTVNEEIAQ